MKDRLIEFINNLETEETGHNSFKVKSKSCDKEKHIKSYFGFTEIKALLQYISEFIELTNNRHIFDADISMMLDSNCVECMELLLEEMDQ